MPGPYGLIGNGAGAQQPIVPAGPILGPIQQLLDAMQADRAGPAVGDLNAVARAVLPRTSMSPATRRQGVLVLPMEDFATGRVAMSNLPLGTEWVIVSGLTLAVVHNSDRTLQAHVTSNLWPAFTAPKLAYYCLSKAVLASGARMEADVTADPSAYAFEDNAAPLLGDWNTCLRAFAERQQAESSPAHTALAAKALNVATLVSYMRTAHQNMMRGLEAYALPNRRAAELLIMQHLVLNHYFVMYVGAGDVPSDYLADLLNQARLHHEGLIDNSRHIDQGPPKRGRPADRDDQNRNGGGRGAGYGAGGGYAGAGYAGGHGAGAGRGADRDREMQEHRDRERAKNWVPWAILQRNGQHDNWNKKMPAGVTSFCVLHGPGYRNMGHSTAQCRDMQFLAPAWKAKLLALKAPNIGQSLREANGGSEPPVKG
jgi:uncharacterized membrane protein YgcG